MNVLVINCGSSSLKFQLINAESEEVLAKGICERIGIDGRLTYQPEGGEKEVSEKAMPTHTEAIQFVSCRTSCRTRRRKVCILSCDYRRSEESDRGM